MPRKIWDNESDWSGLYYHRDPITGVQSGYSRAWATSGHDPSIVPPNYAIRRDRLLSLFPVDSTDRILVAGAGLGFLVEAFQRHTPSYPYVAGFDMSPWIIASAAEVHASVTILDGDWRGVGNLSGPLRDLQRDMGLKGQQANGRWDWLISESVLESYDDAELDELYDGAELALDHADLSKIIHLVHEPPFADEFVGLFNEKTLAGWKATRPTHTFVSLDTYEVN